MRCEAIVKWSILTSAATMMLFCAAARAQITVSEDVNAAFEKLASAPATQFENLPQTSDNDVEPQLINGTPVNPKDFPAVFRMTTGGACTAAVVGPAAVLTAAHCVGQLQRVRFVAGGVAIDSICERAPGYLTSPGQSEDWAMCLLSKNIGGIPYESVDLGPAPALNDRVVLTGYGCTAQGGSIDGLLRIGVSIVSSKPVASWPDEPATIYTTSDASAGEAILCPGDSGGPLYRLDSGDFADRVVIGVNSRTNFVANSLFAATGSAAGAAFLRDWVERHDQQVCGINLSFGCQ